MLVPSCVGTELNRHLESADKELAARASKANGVIRKLIQAGHAQIQGDPHELNVIADQVIQGVVLRFRTTRNIAVLTNDVNLARALYNLHSQQAVQSRKKVRVLKLHATTSELNLLIIRRAADTDTPPVKRKTPLATNNNHQVTVAPFKQSTRVERQRDTPIKVSGELQTGDTIKLENGTTFLLGAKLGSGGEGAVYAVKGLPEVCKLYSKDRLTEGAHEKVKLLASRKVSFPGICWPKEIVRDVKGEFRGFLMSAATGVPLGQSLFLPTPFLGKHPKWNRRDSTKLAITILEQIEYLHGLGIILGDINPQNFLLSDTGKVSLVDCDSFQVEGYPCPVGTVNFTPPELQGQDFKSTLRTLEHELFAVATLVFMIYFPGKSPYSHTGGGDGRENIKKGVFIYNQTWERGGHQAPMGVWRYCWSHLTPRIRRLFELTFDIQKRSQARATVSEWLYALRQYQHHLNDPSRVFNGPKPDWGYDLCIMPQSLLYRRDKVDGPSPPADGRTGYDTLLKQALEKLSASAPVVQKKQTLGSYQRNSYSQSSSSTYQSNSAGYSRQSAAKRNTPKKKSNWFNKLVFELSKFALWVFLVYILFIRGFLWTILFWIVNRIQSS